MWRIAILVAAAVGGIARTSTAQDAAQVQLILTCTATGASSVRLKLVLLGARAGPSPEAALVAFMPTSGGAPLNLPAPGPRPLTMPLKASEWAADQIEVMDLGEISLAPPCPGAVVVSGGVAAQGLRPLGTLRRGAAGTPATFVRAYPQGEPKAGTSRVLLVAAYEPSAEGQFTIRLACFNCGERLATDYDAFLHFEPAPTGTDLTTTSALGLFPAGKATDSSGWSAGDVAVVQFGPYHVPDGMPEFIYLRAGLYNRQGDGARLAIASPDDTSRALIGRLVTRGGRTWFERAALPGALLPTGWAAPTKGMAPR